MYLICVELSYLMLSYITRYCVVTCVMILQLFYNNFINYYRTMYCRVETTDIENSFIFSGVFVELRYFIYFMSVIISFELFLLQNIVVRRLVRMF